jgi:hypothetical protein
MIGGFGNSFVPILIGAMYRDIYIGDRIEPSASLVKIESDFVPVQLWSDSFF